MPKLLDTLKKIARPTVHPRKKEKKEASGKVAETTHAKIAEAMMNADEDEDEGSTLDTIMQDVFGGRARVAGLLQNEVVHEYEDEKGAKFWRDGTPVHCPAWTRRKGQEDAFRSGTLHFNPKRKGVVRRRVVLSLEFREDGTSLRKRKNEANAQAKAIERQTRLEVEQRLREQAQQDKQESEHLRQQRLVREEKRWQQWAMKELTHVHHPLWFELGEKIDHAVAVRRKPLGRAEYVTGVDVWTSLGRELNVREKDDGVEFKEGNESRKKRIRQVIARWQRGEDFSSEPISIWLGAGDIWGAKVKIASHSHNDPTYPRRGEKWEIGLDGKGTWLARNEKTNEWRRIRRV